MQHHVFFAVSALLAALVGLTSNAPAQDVRSRDSAGVRIIENSARKDAPVRFRLGDRPLLEVGGPESNADEAFEHNQGYLRAVQLSDGGLVVIDVSRVHYFDPVGRRTRIVGHKRPRPGEFLYLISICRTRGDTVVVSDSHNESLTVLDARGGIVKTFFQKDNGSAPFSFCLGDGSFVLQQSLGEITSRQQRITRLRTDGTVTNIVGTFDLPPFDMVTQVAPTFVAFGDALFYGDPFTGEIREYDASGRLRRLIRTADKGDSITDADAEQRMSMTIPTNVTALERTTRMERMRAMRRPQNWPVFRGIEVGSDGTIWVQDFQKSYPSPDMWTAIDSTGRIVGRLELPPPMERTPRPQVLSFGRDQVLMRRFDANRATYLNIYQLIPVDGRSR